MRVFYGLSLNSSIINVFTIETSSNMEFRDQPSCLETDREKDGLERGGGGEGEVHCFQSGMFFQKLKFSIS